MNHPSTPHPSWCDPAVCDGRNHYSAMLVVEPTPDNPIRVVLRLAAPLGETVVVVELVDSAPAERQPTNLGTALLSIRRAGDLIGHLDRMLGLAYGIPLSGDPQ